MLQQKEARCGSGHSGRLSPTMEATMIARRLLVSRQSWRQAAVSALQASDAAGAVLSPASGQDRRIWPSRAPDLISLHAPSPTSCPRGSSRPFIVENRPGAAGNLGAEAVAKSAPDGHTLLVSLNTTFTVNPSLYKKPPFDPNTDFRYISILAKSTHHARRAFVRTGQFGGRVRRLREEGAHQLRPWRSRHARPSVRWNISACWPASRRCRCPIAATRNWRPTWLPARSSLVL